MRGASCNTKEQREDLEKHLSVPVRGASCNDIEAFEDESILLSVPVRGASCNEGLNKKLFDIETFRPREGCELQCF